MKGPWRVNVFLSLQLYTAYTFYQQQHSKYHLLHSLEKYITVV